MFQEAKSSRSCLVTKPIDIYPGGDVLSTSLIFSHQISWSYRLRRECKCSLIFKDALQAFYFFPEKSTQAGMSSHQPFWGTHMVILTWCSWGCCWECGQTVTHLSLILMLPPPDGATFQRSLMCAWLSVLLTPPSLLQCHPLKWAIASWWKALPRWRLVLLFLSCLFPFFNRID